MSPSTIEPEAGTEELEGRAWRWSVRVAYTALLAAELWLVWDWYRETPSGQEAIARFRQRVERWKVAAQECEGCRKRKAMLEAAINRMHWDAERIIEGEDVPTQPEGDE